MKNSFLKKISYICIHKKKDTMSNSDNNRRIARNTFLLYIRMLFNMAVSLYTSRAVLNILGIDDFGIYNVVGGVIMMFTFLNNAMTASTQRFLTFEIGKNASIHKVFSSSILIHRSIALIIFILSETIGLWFVNSQLNISVDRMTAANWVYQCSIFICIINIISLPYNATIIAYEKMKAFAYISIIETCLKLIVVLLLPLFSFDKLIIYSLLLLSIFIIIRIIYTRYCHCEFPITKEKLYMDKKIFKEMASFASWSMLGNIALITYTQGVNILLNIFFGPAINAARGIAIQVQNTINSFCLNFQTALNPQITKSFAAYELPYMHSLIIRSSKFSFYLLLILSLPVLIETNIILTWWLKEVPRYTVNFVRLMLLISMVEVMSNPLIISAQATGKIQLYQITIGSVLICILPLSYIALKFGFSPNSVFIIHLSVVCIAQGVRLCIIRPMIQLSLKYYFQEVILKIGTIFILSLVIPYSLHNLLPTIWWSFILVCFACVCSTLFLIYRIGLTKQEQLFFQQKIQLLKNKL